MKSSIHLMTLVFAILIAFSSYANVVHTNENWDAFSKNLVWCMQIKNEGVQTSAMQQIIRYGDRLDVEDAVFDVVRLYRNHDNEKVRQLALSALHKMQNKWAMDFLKRNVNYEKSPALKKQIYCILQNYQLKMADTIQKKDEIILAQKD